MPLGLITVVAECDSHQSRVHTPRLAELCPRYVTRAGVHSTGRRRLLSAKRTVVRDLGYEIFIAA